MKFGKPASAHVRQSNLYTGFAYVPTSIEQFRNLKLRLEVNLIHIVIGIP